MRIGIDARPLQSQRRGVGQYLFYLLKHLARIDRDNQYVLFYNYFWSLDGFSPFTCDNPNFSDKVFRFPTHLLDLFWKNFSFPKVDSLMGDVDVFHESLLHTVPPCRGSVVVTLYDFVPMHYPEYYSRSYLEKYQHSLRQVANRAAHVIAISESTKRDVVSFTSIPAERVSVVYPGVDPQFRPLSKEARLDEVLRAKHLDESYILYVGAANRHKNLGTLLAAYRALAPELRRDYLLAFAGNVSWDYELLLNEARRLDLSDRVRCIGYVSDEDLPFIYSGASLVVFPSLYEGFGFVPLEAMACGTPAISSNTSSMPEVVGDAGILFDPNDTVALTHAMNAALTDQALRATLVGKGLHRAPTFSWERTARQTLDVYRSVASARGRGALG
ncbi:MAG: glycosyltransferase family 4 protein [Planctomycetes bacterium]|nr:glycosyltransferase family 4 protein [Planctomycetota bacterium]MBM4078206.1 glycosyltransferase family 4 protein [Planctomycetota bacterium]